MRGTGADISQITTPLCHKEEKQHNIVVLSGKMGEERVGAISNEVDGGGGGDKKARVGMSLPDPSPLPPLKSAAFGTSIRGGEQKPRNCCLLFRPPPFPPGGRGRDNKCPRFVWPPIYDLRPGRREWGFHFEECRHLLRCKYCNTRVDSFLKKKSRNEKETRFLVKRRRGRLEISLMP